MSNTQALHEEPSRTNLGPGDRLQAQRIAMGLTLEELAKKMRLSVAILKSIEENDFSQISAPIFVKGYLRSYARIVNADENDIITRYITDYTDEDPPISSTSNTAPEINADDSRVKWVTYLVIFALISLLVVWWWNRYQQPAETLSLDTTVDDISVTQERSPATPSETGSDTPIVPPLSTTGTDEESELTRQPSVLGTTEIPVTEPTQSLVSAEPSATSEPEPAAQPPATMEPESLSQAEPITGSQPSPLAQADADLVVRVSADSWLDIKDSEGNQLVYDLAQTGETLSFSGQPPFRVFLGNARGISITYRGEEIDVSRRIRDDNTARLRVGQ